MSGTATVPNTTGLSNAETTVLSNVYYTLKFSDGRATLTTGTGAQPDRFPDACVLYAVTADVGTAPTGQAILIDVNKNGSTIFTVLHTSQPTILAGTKTATVLAVLAGSPSFTSTDIITVDIDQVGSTIAGGQLTVGVHATPL